MSEDIEFEPFDKAPDTRIISLSNQYQVSLGGFGDPSDGFRTYFTCLKVSQLKDDITTFKKLTEDNSWPVSQILQREINKRRIDEISNNYIRIKGRDIKYFPPLTVAILPRDSNDRISKSYNYNKVNDISSRDQIFKKSIFSGVDKAKEIFQKAEDKSVIKDFFLLEISKQFNFNILCWDKSKYYAIVIDGQHRFESLLKSAESDSKILDYIQDVVFIDLSILLKKTIPEKNLLPVKAIRTVFIDINSSAQVVSTVRRILMDDKDLASLCVQSLINDEDNQEGDRAGEYLKPQLIDWHVEALKHELPHITSVLILHQIISDNLLKGKNLSSIDELRDKNRVRYWVNIVNSRFKVDKKISKESVYSNYNKLGDSLNAYLIESNDDNFEGESSDFIFSFDYRVLKVAQETFDSIYKRSIVKCFNEITPFKCVSDYLKKPEFDAFNSSKVLYKGLVATKDELKINFSYQEEVIRLRKALKQDLNPKYSLIYTVLGQKAIFELYFKRMDLEYNESFIEESVIIFTEKFISQINVMFALVNQNSRSIFGDLEIEVPEIFLKGVEHLGVLGTSFWEGIIYQEKRMIYTTRGINSLRSLIEYILNFISNYRSTSTELSKEDFKIGYLSDRIKRSILRRDDGYEENEVSTFVDLIVESKRKFINSYLLEALKKNEVA